MSSIILSGITYQSNHTSHESMEIDETSVPFAPSRGQKRLRSSSFEHPDTGDVGSIRFLPTPLSGSSTVRVPKKRRVQYLEPEELDNVQSSIDALSQAVHALAYKYTPLALKHSHRLTIKIPARSPFAFTISQPTPNSTPKSPASPSSKPRMAYEGLNFRWPENKPTLVPYPLRGAENKKPLTIRIRIPKSRSSKIQVAKKLPRQKRNDGISPKLRLRIRTMLRLELGLRSLRV